MKIKSVIVIIVVLAATFFGFIYSGIYNIAATESHFRAVAWILHTIMKESVKSRASDVKAPPDLDARKREGFKEFYEMCELCHGGPEVKPSPIGKGLNPKPPDLKKKAVDWSEAELFWIIKNGIKMSGMPGFGPTHRDEEVWHIVAFVKHLPDMAPEEYRSLAQKEQHRTTGHMRGRSLEKK